MAENNAAEVASAFVYWTNRLSTVNVRPLIARAPVAARSMLLIPPSLMTRPDLPGAVPNVTISDEDSPEAGVNVIVAAPVTE